MQIVISPGEKKYHKFEPRIDGTKSIPVGSSGHEDFAIHEDLKRKERYLQRHAKT